MLIKIKLNVFVYKFIPIYALTFKGTRVGRKATENIPLDDYYYLKRLKCIL